MRVTVPVPWGTRLRAWIDRRRGTVVDPVLARAQAAGRLELGTEVRLLLHGPVPRVGRPLSRIHHDIRTALALATHAILESPVSPTEQARAIRHLRLALEAATGQPKFREREPLQPSATSPAWPRPESPPRRPVA